MDRKRCIVPTQHLDVIPHAVSAKQANHAAGAQQALGNNTLEHLPGVGVQGAGLLSHARVIEDLRIPALELPRLEKRAPIDIADELGERIVVKKMNSGFARSCELDPTPVQSHLVLPSGSDGNEFGSGGSGRVRLPLLRAAPRVQGVCPEIVLGDRFGAAASRALVAFTQRAFERAGFVVARNAPFAGGYITQRYGRPQQGVHAIQIEIDRGLYLDQARLEPLPVFDEIRERLSQVIGDLVEIAPGVDGVVAGLAAE